MTINQMRSYILEKYPNAGQKFREKVTRMPTNQVIAIYKSLLSRKEKPKQSNDYHQIDIWEYMTSKNEFDGGPGTHTDISQKLHTL